MTPKTLETANGLSASSLTKRNVLFYPTSNLFPLTLRGLIIAFLLYYFATQLTIVHNDILAAVLTFSLGLVLAATLILTMVWSWHLKGRLFVTSVQALSAHRGQAPLTSSTYSSMDSTSSGSSVEAGTPTILTLSLTRLSLPPFYKLTAEITLKDSFKLSPALIKSSTEINSLVVPKGSNNPVIFNLRFPHRGEWSVDKLELRLSDQFGLTQKRWLVLGKILDAENRYTIQVDPFNPPRESANFPILTSRDREGDNLHQSNSRLGEPFDLKRYSPSDGLKKVVWKVFARTGELISRHPESAMTPEGECYIFVIAGPSPLGDRIVRDAIDYCSALEEAGIELRLGCAGSPSGATATSSSAALEILRRSAWSIDPSVANSSAKLQNSAFKLPLLRLLGLFGHKEWAWSKVFGLQHKKDTGSNQRRERDDSPLTSSISSFINSQPANSPIKRLIVFLAPEDQIEEHQIIGSLVEISRLNISPVLMLTLDKSSSSFNPLNSKNISVKERRDSYPQTLSSAQTDLQLVPRPPFIALAYQWFLTPPITERDNYIQVAIKDLLQASFQHGWDIYPKSSR